MNNGQRIRSPGYTLIELVVVVAIIGIVTAIGLPIYLNTKNTARDTAAVYNLDNMLISLQTAATTLTDDGQSWSTNAAVNIADIQTMLTSSKATNPWNLQQPAYNPILANLTWEADGATSLDAMINSLDEMQGTAMSLPVNKGQCYFGIALPWPKLDGNASAPGFIIGVVITSSGKVVKSTTFE